MRSGSVSGPSPPADIDVLVIGEADLREVRRAFRAVEADLRVEINPVVVNSTDWEAPADSPFLLEFKQRPLVPISPPTRRRLRMRGWARTLQPASSTESFQTQDTSTLRVGCQRVHVYVDRP